MLGFDHIIVQTIVALSLTRKMSAYYYACLLFNNNSNNIIIIILYYPFKN